MAALIASKTRAQIRELIAHLTGAGIVSTASTNGDSASLIDTAGLPSDGDNEYNGSNVIMISGTAGNIGVQRWVSAYDGATKDCTIGNAFGSSIVAADGYELWLPPYRILEINSEIGLAELEVYDSVYVDKSDTSVFTEENRYRYPIPSGFVKLDGIEYCASVANEKVINACDTVWSELVDVDVTASIDTTIKKEGTGALKLVIAAGCGASDIFATQAISPALNLGDKTEVEIWIYSTLTLTAGQVKLLLDDTASCASPVETLSIPATTSYTWTRHVISLANPSSDSAIISVGLQMGTDNLGAFTLWADDIRAVDANSRKYKELWPDYWELVHGSTDYITIPSKALSVTGTNKQLRISGYSAITQMSADSSTSQVSPEFIAYRVAGNMMVRHGLRGESDPKARLSKANYYQAQADRLKAQTTTNFRPNTRTI